MQIKDMICYLDGSIEDIEHPVEERFSLFVMCYTLCQMLEKNLEHTEIIRSDFFRLENDGYTLTCLLKSDSVYYLTDEHLNPLTDTFSSITAMFETNDDVNIKKEIYESLKKISDRLSLLNDKCSSFIDNKTAFSLMRNICRNYNAVSPVYLVRKDNYVGIIDCRGRYVIETKYLQITPFVLDEEFYDNKSFLSQYTNNVAVVKDLLYVCLKDENSVNHKNCYDVYDANGNIVFEGVSNIYTKKQMVYSISNSNKLFDSVPCEKKTLAISVGVNVPFRYKLWDCDENDKYYYDLTEERYEFDLTTIFKKIKKKRAKNEPLQLNVVNPNLAVKYDNISLQFINKSKIKFLLTMAQVFSSLYGIVDEEFETFKEFCDFVYSNIPLEGAYKGMNVKELDIPVKIYNCLIRSGINTVDELIEYSDEQIENIRNIGKNGAYEVILIRNRLRKTFEINEEE